MTFSSLSTVTANLLSQTLRITEIFYSLQGESTTIGEPTVFIRLTGCPLRCIYCDTSYAFTGGQHIAIKDILEEIHSYQCQYICVTGGEPLAQPACISLLATLCNAGYFVSLETSGARDVSKVDERVMIVMDLKTPASGEATKNLFANLSYLKKSDQIKFVLCDRNDYEWACDIIIQYKLLERVKVLFSPCWETLQPTTLAEWILQDKLAVRFQLQLHKILWNNLPGR